MTAAACSQNRVSYFPSYKLTVTQGNEIDEEALASLSEGMTRAQVQMLIGTPLLQDPFHDGRWDYPYFVTRNKVMRQQGTLTLIFDGDTLSEIIRRPMPENVQ